MGSLDVEGESMYVWYACYGSNLWQPRFLCYLQGGQVDGMSRPCAGSADEAPPLASDWLVIPHHLFFGRSYTSTWGKGGVAFLHISPKEGVSTHARLYKIRLQQFIDLFIQENLEDWNNRHVILDAVLKALSTPFFKYSEVIKDGWYGTVLHLGDKDGCPILTFTCSPCQLEMFNSGLLPVLPPSESYQQVIVRGLMEQSGFSEAAALSYVSSKVNFSI